GIGLVGDGGSGHYVKMVHNAIEYGMMQAIGEGFDLLRNGSKKDLDVKKVAHIWNHGTVVSSFLMEMVERALKADSTLAGVAPWVEDSGEGRWCVHDAISNGVPFVSNTYALNARFQSRETDSFALKLLACLRKEFGGHGVKSDYTSNA
ncbi:MAG: 6-phosphogluconate dehydrogenase, partial [Gammaproteobacteria bacterium]|nr:6-phosphogluconate dehydrogenase [Gammaproteobacteria bacterium]